MKYFKVTLSAGDPVLIDEDEVKPVLEGIARNDRAVICRRGAFNPSFYISILEDKKKNREVMEDERLGMDVSPEPSPFAKILAGKMPQISSRSRTLAQEQAARETRSSR